MPNTQARSYDFITGDTLVVDPLAVKYCGGCHQTLSVLEFSKLHSTGDGLAYRCKKCKNNELRKYYRDNRTKQLARAKQYADANPERIKANTARQTALRQTNPTCYSKYRQRALTTQYQITLLEYEQMEYAQRELCAICKQPELRGYRGINKRLTVDHDHKTGRIRRLLCSDCNNMLGIVNDDDKLLMAAQSYLIIRSCVTVAPQLRLYDANLLAMIRQTRSKNYIYKLNRRHGLTLECYASILVSQNHMCGICCGSERVRTNGKIRQLAVDHDHNTGIVRGLLCFRCNTLLGAARDDKVIINLAVQYLREHREDA